MSWLSWNSMVRVQTSAGETMRTSGSGFTVWSQYQTILTYWFGICEVSLMHARASFVSQSAGAFSGGSSSSALRFLGGFFALHVIGLAQVTLKRLSPPVPAELGMGSTSWQFTGMSGRPSKVSFARRPKSVNTRALAFSFADA